MIVYPSLLFEDDTEMTVVDMSCGSRHSAAITGSHLVGVCSVGTFKCRGGKGQRIDRIEGWKGEALRLPVTTVRQPRRLTLHLIHYKQQLKSCTKM